MPALVRKVHHLLLMLPVANEVLAATGDTGGRPTFTSGMDGEQTVVGLGLRHKDAGQVERQHGTASDGEVRIVAVGAQTGRTKKTPAT